MVNSELISTLFIYVCVCVQVCLHRLKSFFHWRCWRGTWKRPSSFNFYGSYIRVYLYIYIYAIYICTRMKHCGCSLLYLCEWKWITIVPRSFALWPSVTCSKLVFIRYHVHAPLLIDIIIWRTLPVQRNQFYFPRKDLFISLYISFFIQSFR